MNVFHSLLFLLQNCIAVIVTFGSKLITYHSGFQHYPTLRVGEYRLTNNCMFKVWAEQIECRYYILLIVLGNNKCMTLSVHAMQRSNMVVQNWVLHIMIDQCLVLDDYGHYANLFHTVQQIFLFHSNISCGLILGAVTNCIVTQYVMWPDFRCSNQLYCDPISHVA